jgi:hypothetical protein
MRQKIKRTKTGADLKERQERNVELQMMKSNQLRAGTHANKEDTLHKQLKASQ